METLKAEKEKAQSQELKGVRSMDRKDYAKHKNETLRAVRKLKYGAPGYPLPEPTKPVREMTAKEYREFKANLLRSTRQGEHK